MNNRACLLSVLFLPLLLCACGVDRPFYLRAWERDRLAAEKARTQHHLQSAERHARDAVSQAEHLGAADFRLAVSLYDLACIYILREKYKLAQPLIERSLEVLHRASLYSSAFIDREIIQQERARAYLVLGDLDYRRKDYRKALSDYDNARKLLEQWCNSERLESSNPLGTEFVRSIWGQAECQFALKNNATAEEHFRQSLRLAEANAYPLSRDLQERFSEFLRSQGRENEGETAADKWRALSVKGRECAKKKDYKLARQYFLSALEEAKLFRPDDVRLAATYKNIGDMSTRLGDRLMCELYYEKAYDVCKKMGQPLFALTDDLLQDIAAVKMVLGKFEDSEKCYRDDLAMREKYYGSGEKTAEIMLQLAELEMLRGNIEKQHSYAIESLKTILRDHGSRRKTASSFQRLSAVFTNVHDYARAQQCMDEALRIWKDRLELRGERISSNLYRQAFLAALQNKSADEKEYLERARQSLKVADGGEFLSIARLIRTQLLEIRNRPNRQLISGKLHQWHRDLLKMAAESDLASDQATTKNLQKIVQEANRY